MGNFLAKWYRVYIIKYSDNLSKIEKPDIAIFETYMIE